MLNRAIETLTKAIGKRPVGYRAVVAIQPVDMSG
jgi:hypothetical protein